MEIKMQLKINDRIKIEMYLREGKSIKYISELIGVSYHTILREITNRRVLKFNSRLPYGHISTIDEHNCDILKKQPVVCNKCPRFHKNNCTHDFVVYDSIKANEIYLEGKKKKSTPKRDNFLKLVEKYIKRGQPISHISVNIYRKYGETINRKTIYDWSRLGLLKYNKRKRIQ